MQDCGNGDPVDESGGGFGELIFMSDGEKIGVCCIVGKPRGEFNTSIITGIDLMDKLGNLIQAARIIVFIVV